MLFQTARARSLQFCIIGLLLIGSLAGCSAVRTGYNNAPALLQWWLDDYLDFTAAQEPQVRESLVALQDWHRQNELPLYLDSLQQMRELAMQSVTPQQVCTVQDQVRGHLQRVGKRMADGLARLAPTLQPAQLEYMAREFERQNQKWRKEWLDPSPLELAAYRLNKSSERAENFYGRLQAPQLAALRERIAVSSFEPQMLWRERLRRQQDMLATLREHRSGERPAHVKAEMLALMQRSLNSPDPQSRQRFEQMLQENCLTLAALHNSSNPSQRLHLAGKLEDYENDVRALIAQP